MKTRKPLVPALLLVIATLLGVLVVVRVAVALESEAARFEAETMSETSSRISVVDDNGTQALRFVNTPASASKSVSFSANAQMTKIRVRGVDHSGPTRTLSSVRVSVDGVQVLSQQVSGSYSTLTAPISVGAGNHTVSVNMTNRDTGERIFVDWIAFTYSESPPPTECPEGKYLATYRNESAAQAFTTQPVLSRCESAPLNYGWGTSSPAPGVNADDFTVLWKGNFNFEGGEYTFSARSDDGIRVYVDGTRILDEWRDQGAADFRTTRTLTAGTHEVKVEYYENGRDAVARLSWVKVASEPPPSEACTTFSSPITITSGGTYSGCWQSTSFNTPAVTVSTTQPVVIQNSGIKATGYKVRSSIQNADVTIRRTRFTGMNPNVSGQSTEYAVWLLSPQNVVVENNHFERTPGVKIHDMFAPRSGGVKVRYNTASNIDARRSNGVGGYSGGHQLRQFFQSDHVQGVPVEVAWNQIINEPGQSAVEDIINLYLSRGTSANPINVHDNYIDGAFPSVSGPNTTWLSYSGGGILCADGPATTDVGAGAYAHCHHNQVIDSLNYGMAIAHGHHIEVDNNRMVGDTDNIALQSWDGVGAHCQNMDSTPTFHDNSLHDNAVAWMANGHRNDYWLSGICAGEATNTSLPSVGEAAEWSLWQSKLASANVTLGP
jgi:PA14 domain